MTLMVEPQIKPMTVDEFLAMPNSDDYELIDGVPTEKRPMGALSGKVGARVIVRLGTFCERVDAGHLFDSDAIYRCFGNVRTGRKADVSFIRKGRLPDEQVPEGAINIPADLVVEIVSPTDLAYDVEAKAKLYLENGFGELWVVFPNTRTVHVRRPGAAGVILGADDTLAGSGPLSGFACKVGEFFALG